MNDNPEGYTGDGHYFKAGVYNQCRAIPKQPQGAARERAIGPSTANGDYAQVSFSRLVVSGLNRKVHLAMSKVFDVYYLWARSASHRLYHRHGQRYVHDCCR